jgi:hypothetical protein
MEDTDGIPLDGEPELTEAERKMFRRMLRDDERASWAWRKVRVWVPIVGSSIFALFQAWDWLAKHVTLKP